MPLVAAKTIYEHARSGNYAVGGFDAEHLFMVKAIMDAAEECRSPVIVFLWEADILAAGEGFLESVVKHAGTRASVPVAIMLDHGTSIEFCMRCVMNGHTGVMLDASHFPLEKNIAESRKLVEMCHTVGAIVEGEVGTVRRTFESTGEYAEETVYTDPAEAEIYCARSGVDSLAISIGTESGVYKELPKLDFERLREIRSRTDAYLVLHGGSGTPSDQIQRAVADGISGIRFATEMRIAFFDELEARRRELGLENPDSRLILGPAADAAKACIIKRMGQLGSVDKTFADAQPKTFAVKTRAPTSRPSAVDVDEIVKLVSDRLRSELADV